MRDAGESSLSTPVVPAASKTYSRHRSPGDFCSIGVPGDRTHNCAMAGLPGRLPMENHRSIKGLDRQLRERVGSSDQIPQMTSVSGRGGSISRQTPGPLQRMVELNPPAADR